MCGLKYSTLLAVLLVIVPGCCIAIEANSQPERCNLYKPAKTIDCPGNKSSRYFFHTSKGCKRSGFCDPEDTSIYDKQNDKNYFLTKEDCAAACQMHVRCPTLEPIVNGTVSNDGVGYWGSSVEYSCDNGFILLGRAIRTCESEGVWTSEAPLCIAKCPKPNTNGPFTFSPLQEFYTPGDTIVYNCEQGFGQVGQNKGRECLENGAWSGNEISCEVELQCTKEALRPIEHGSVLAPDSRSVGSKVSFSCDKGYIMYGNATVQCNEEGQWSGAQPICWKIIIEMCEQSDPDHAGSDVTNVTISLVQGERNTWFIPSISNPNPFENKTFQWDEENIDTLPGVSIDESRLKITTVLATGVKQRKYSVSFCGYKAFFVINVTTPPPSMPAQPIFHPYNVVVESLGDEFTMMCVFQGIPSPTVTWYRNESSIHVDERTTITSTKISPAFTTSTLSVQAITSNDLGSYRCMGNNGDGSPVFSDSGSVTLADSKKAKRFAEENSPSLCVGKTPSSDTVTIVGRVRRENVKLNSPISTVYRMRVDSVLSSGTERLSKRNLRTIVFDHNAEAQQKLNSNGLYILQGRLHENTLLVQSHNSILNHSLELEHSVQQC